MPLTDLQLRTVRPAERPQRLFDGNGLYLEISPAGGKLWRLKYRYGGKEKRLALGKYPEVGLREARVRTEQARRLLAASRDPGAEKKTAKALKLQQSEHSFENVARAWLKHQAARWVGVTHARAVASLETDVFPVLGTVPIADIRAKDVAAAVKAVEARGVGETAARVLQRIRSVFRYAIVHDLIETNPTLDVVASELLRPRRVKHRAALPQTELPTFLTALERYQGDVATGNALRLLMLTATRPGELRGARWEEFDMSLAHWRIPASRMKMRQEHLVPLSRQALDVLNLMLALRGESGLVFPSPYYPNQALSENTLNSALARMGYKGIATAHGFRALFSTVANEAGFDADVIERQLAHSERNEVRAAYHRAAYVAQRRELLQWWADFLDQQLGKSGTRTRGK